MSVPGRIPRATSISYTTCVPHFGRGRLITPTFVRSISRRALCVIPQNHSEDIRLLSCGKMLHFFREIQLRTRLGGRTDYRVLRWEILNWRPFPTQRPDRLSRWINAFWRGGLNCRHMCELPMRRNCQRPDQRQRTPYLVPTILDGRAAKFHQRRSRGTSDR